MHKGPGGQEAPGRGVAVQVSAVSTKHSEETNGTEEGSLGLHSGITRHHTQVKTGKGDSLHTVSASSEGQGPVWLKERRREDHAFRMWKGAVRRPTSLQACARHWMGSLT